MSEKKSVRINKLVKEFNVSIDRIFTFLASKGVKGLNPASKIDYDMYMDLLGEFQPDLKAKIAAKLVAKEKELKKAEEIIQQEKERSEEKSVKKESKPKKEVKVLDKYDLDPKKERKVNSPGPASLAPQSRAAPTIEFFTTSPP